MTQENVKSFPKRKSIPQSVRFEVLKRDSFTCQYCGAKAPDVALQIDHIKPVADGGENDIMNLVTSCFGCNSGKSDTSLDDNSMLEKQRRQLEELNERRNQLELMIQWREGLSSLEDTHLQAIQNEFLRYGPFTANETAEKEIRRWLKKYSIQEIFAALNASYTQYLKTDNDGEVTGESWSRAFNMVPRIINVTRRGGMSEDMKHIYYARGILRNRLTYLKEREVIGLMKDAVAGGLPIEELADIAKEVRNWRQFEDIMYSWITR